MHKYCLLPATSLPHACLNEDSSNYKSQYSCDDIPRLSRTYSARVVKRFHRTTEEKLPSHGDLWLSYLSPQRQKTATDPPVSWKKLVVICGNQGEIFLRGLKSAKYTNSNFSQVRLLQLSSSRIPVQWDSISKVREKIGEHDVGP